jgi:SAM-dependent methyltransferase
MERLEYEVMAHVEDQLWWYVGMRRIADVWLQGLPISTILDAGCGTGGNAKWLTQYGHIVGFDYESMACDYTQQRAIPVACASISTMPFRDQSFDLVTSFDVIYHRAVADDLAALKECYRVVAPGGHLLLRVAAFEWLGGHHHQRVHGARRYTPRGLTSLVQQVTAGTGTGHQRTTIWASHPRPFRRRIAVTACESDWSDGTRHRSRLATDWRITPSWGIIALSCATSR